MKRKPFQAVCDGCCQHSERCLTVALKIKTLVEKYQELANYCPGCRKKTRGQWGWPVEAARTGEELCR